MNLPKSKERQKLAFEKRMDMLIYAVHKKAEFTVHDIFEDAVSIQKMTIRNCLKDLMECGYLEKTSIYTFKATDFAKQLFGVAA